ncbi:MAG TPA: T9SS type A sorting domain-containing protein [candidate division Zixibacteria bacterium]|nr:T9SS type A sorting domain-containing protein [candidate division Zixibacteria bacterium]
MRYKAIGVMILALLTLPGLAMAQFPTFNGVISIDTVVVQAGDHFGVPVRITNNNLEIAGLQIPIQFESSYLTVDSISYVGSLKPTTMSTAEHIDNNSDTLSFVYYPNIDTYPISTITSTSGILATIFFTLSAAAPEGTIGLDSLYTPTSLYWTGVGFSDPDGTMYQPAGFEPGAVIVSLPTAVDDDVVEGLPGEFALSQNYPNPFNPITTIEFSLPRAGHTLLEVYNILGQRVVTLVDANLQAGSHQVEFDGDSQPSGVYFYRITSPEGSQTKKMMLLK